MVTAGRYLQELAPWLAGLLLLGTACSEPLAVDGGVEVDASEPDGSVTVVSVQVGPPVDTEAIHQLCVDTINAYRATLDLPLLERASAAQEDCSDQGAALDAKSGDVHGTSGVDNPCNGTGNWDAFPYFGPQNTCQIDMALDHEGLADGLERCLTEMWDEGEPPGDRQQCIDDFQNGDTACFLKHGHYLNMTGDFQGVSCGVHGYGEASYWINQDFY